MMWMLSVLRSPLFSYALLAVIIAMGIWYTYREGKQSGISQMEAQSLKTVVTIKNEQAKAAANAPRSRIDVIKRLRNGSF